MKTKSLVAGFALAASLPFLAGASLDDYMVGGSEPQASASPAGVRMPDGTVSAGLSPGTNKPLYTTTADAPGLYTESEGEKYCHDLQVSGHHDWLVPAIGELNVLFQNRAAIGGFNEADSGSAGWYWSSSQDNTQPSADGGGFIPRWWGQRFSTGERSLNFKNTPSSLRCVR